MRIQFRERITAKDIKAAFRLLLPSFRLRVELVVPTAICYAIVVTFIFLSSATMETAYVTTLCLTFLFVLVFASQVHDYKYGEVEKVEGTSVLEFKRSDGSQVLSAKPASACQEVTEFVLGDDSVTLSDPKSEMTFPWGQIYKAREGKKHFVLVVWNGEIICGTDLLIVIPKRCLSRQEQDELASFLLETGKFAVPEPPV